MLHEPEYTKSQTYQLVKMLCAMSGVSLKYQDIRVAIADVDSYDIRTISMPIDETVFLDQTRVLCHELAHFLIENFFNDEDGRSSHFIEHCSDQVGNSILLLAEKIVEEAEGNGEELSTYLMEKINNSLLETDTTPPQQQVLEDT